jgi:hypothetical protein
LNIYTILGRAVSNYTGSAHLALLSVVLNAVIKDFGPAWLEARHIAAPGEGQAVVRELEKLYSGIIDAYIASHPKR